MAHPRSTRREPCGLPTETSTHSFWHSEPSPLLTGHRSTRDLPVTADVVIIGSGMTGTSVAHHLLTESGGKKLDVVMLEAREACWGATGRNGGHCVPMVLDNPHDPSIGRFELANFQAIMSLVSDKKIECEYVAQTGVRAIYDRSTVIDAELAIMKMQETAPDLAEIMRITTDKDELERLRIPTAVGAAVSSVAAKFWPYKFVSRILEDLLTSTDLKGTLNLQTLTPVECIAPCDVDRWTVKTNRGCIIASKLVLATNAYTSHLLPDFADLIVPCRGQMSALKPFPSVAGEARLKSNYGFMGQGTDDYLVQRPNEGGGDLMFGGGRQHGRSMGVTDDSVIDETVARYLRGRLVDAFRLPEGKNAQPVKKCCRCKRKVRLTEGYRLPPHICTCNVLEKPADCRAWRAVEAGNRVEFTASHEWTGIMGYSRDDLPWVGPVPNKPNLYVTAGFTGHGMPNTWLCGQSVAKMVEADKTESIADALQEFGLPQAYVVTSERIAEAMQLEDVEAKDWAEMERGRQRAGGDRPLSGYA